MARKTFISYKYSEAQETRDRIIRSLGSDATYYTGETSQSPDLGDLKTQTIKNKLADMIFSTSVLIVVISQNVDESNWVKWEINYATGKQTRNGIQSQPDGVVMVLEDSLVNSNGNFMHNRTTRLITEKSNPAICTVSSFLYNPQKYIEQAYSQRKTD